MKMCLMNAELADFDAAAAKEQVKLTKALKKQAKGPLNRSISHPKRIENDMIKERSFSSS